VRGRVLVRPPAGSSYEGSGTGQAG
jgi:hypothetical protein